MIHSVRRCGKPVGCARTWYAYATKNRQAAAVKGMSVVSCHRSDVHAVRRCTDFLDSFIREVLHHCYRVTGRTDPDPSVRQDVERRGNFECSSIGTSAPRQINGSATAVRFIPSSRASSIAAANSLRNGLTPPKVATKLSSHPPKVLRIDIPLPVKSVSDMREISGTKQTLMFKFSELTRNSQKASGRQVRPRLFAQSPNTETPYLHILQASSNSSLEQFSMIRCCSQNFPQEANLTVDSGRRTRHGRPTENYIPVHIGDISSRLPYGFQFEARPNGLSLAILHVSVERQIGSIQLEKTNLKNRYRFQFFGLSSCLSQIGPIEFMA